MGDRIENNRELEGFIISAVIVIATGIYGFLRGYNLGQMREREDNNYEKARIGLVTTQPATRQGDAGGLDYRVKEIDANSGRR